MKIAPVGLNNTKLFTLAFEGRQRTRTFVPEEILGEEDTFTKRDDTYTKRYKELMKNADAAVRKSESRKPPLTTRDINFLLEKTFSSKNRIR